ncbi:MAG: sensor histidine kinase [Spirochaetes bacterium]|nr:sensor histidine kinase [Spirochaetota bacterium]MBU1080250.1 sensor histidine kinase [Spirochaetota bacterium]
MDSDRSAFSALFSDVLKNILSLADSPGRCASYIAKQLRELIGSRAVVALARTSDSEDFGIVSAFPERRRTIAGHEAVKEIAWLSAGLERSTLVSPAGDGPVPEALRRLGCGPSIVAPIRCSDRCMGMLVILDLLDSTGTGTIMETLDRLTPVFGLILRNSYLYDTLERKVSDRTRDLEERGERLEAALHDKEVMIKEVHHRVKNNLQIITSLLYLQAETSEDARLQEALEKCQARIRSMALVHEELYRSEDLASVDMAQYIRKLCDGLSATFDFPGPIHYDCGDVKLPITQSIPCGLILNELVTNSLKYAYPGGPNGAIRVCLYDDGRELVLVVEDDGVGIGPGRETAHSLGLTLVNGLVDQLSGLIRLEDRSTAAGERGTRARITFEREGP